RVVRIAVVDRLNPEQGEIALVFFWGANLPGDGRAGSQAEAANLTGRDIDIVRAREIVIVGAAEEAKAVRQDLQRPLAEHQTVHLDPLFQDSKDQVLPLEAGEFGQVFSPGLFDE